MRAFIILALCTIVSTLTHAQNAQDRKAVNKVILAFQDDFNDGAFLNSHYYAADDWVHINPAGGIKKGREKVLKDVREVHQSFLKNVSMTIDSIDIRFVTSTVAVADVIHRISPYELPKGIRHENERHVKLYVVVKKNGRWLLTHDQNTIVQGSNTAEKPE